MHIIYPKFYDVEPMSTHRPAEHLWQKVDKMYFIARSEMAKRTPATTAEPLAPNWHGFIGHCDCQDTA